MQTRKELYEMLEYDPAAQSWPGYQCDEQRSTKEMKEKGLPNASDGLPLLKLDV